MYFAIVNNPIALQIEKKGARGSRSRGFTVNEERIASLVGKNPILVTALNPVIGYEKGAKIAKRAYAEGKSLKDVALEETELSSEELDKILNPMKLTK